MTICCIFNQVQKFLEERNVNSLTAIETYWAGMGIQRQREGGRVTKHKLLSTWEKNPVLSSLQRAVLLSQKESK